MSAVPEGIAVEKSRRDAPARSSRLEARRDPGLFFGKIILAWRRFAQSRSREEDFQRNIDRSGSEL
jgi:hypothetical protein